MPDPSTVVLEPGRLMALCHPYALNGLVSSHPPKARGFASMNCYLLAEDDRALLIDTGVTIHETAIIEQLTTLLEGRELRMLPLRFGEFGGLCNAQPIAEQFAVAGLYGSLLGEPNEWLEFRPALPRSGTGGARGLADVPGLPLPMGGAVPVSADGERRLEILIAPVRLLPMPWAFDTGTGTLFTADLFGWVTRADDQGPWVVTEEDEDPTTLQDVWCYLRENRYWWLDGARTERLVADLSAVVDSRDVVTIAPGYGCVLHGRDVVRRHVSLLRDALEKAASSPSIGVEVGTWPLRRAA
jgi:hypothetical protein